MRLSSRRAACAVSLFVCAFAASSASSQIRFDATTAGQNVWNRPLEGAPPAALSAVGTAVPYYAYPFSVATAGYYDFLSVATNPANWDNYTFLYQSAFDPDHPLSNALRGNDDFNTTGRSGFNGVNLSAQTTYYLITTGFSNTDFGAFTDTIRPSVSPPTHTSVYNGATAGGPTWNRPIANGSNPPAALSAFATSDPYSTFKFNVTVSGAYNLVSAAVSPTDWDNYAFLYQNNFDPNKPLANVLLGDDDLTKTGDAGFNGVNLLAGTTYYFVTTGYDNTDFGSYSLSIQGPGMVTPEPSFALWLAAAALSGAFLLRRRAQRWLPLVPALALCAAMRPATAQQTDGISAAPHPPTSSVALSGAGSPPQPQAAQTLLMMTSETGDAIGRGKTYVFTPQTGTFSLSYGSNSAGRLTSVTVTYSDNQNYWNATFATDKVPAILTTGYYHDVQEASTALPGYPGLNVNGNAGGSGNLAGAFRVLDANYVSYSGRITVNSFAARFVQRANGATPALRGLLLYKSNAATTDASAPQTIASLSGSLAALTATDADGIGDIDRTYYQLDGGPTTLYTAPFSVGGSIGQAHTVTCWSVDLAGNQEPSKSFTLTPATQSSYQITLTGDPDDTVGAGNSLVFTPATGAAILQTQGAGNSDKIGRVTLTYGEPGPNGHTFTMALASSAIPAPLAPGYYNKAQIVSGYVSGQNSITGFPGVYAALDGRTPNYPTGAFRIISMNVNNGGPTPQILSMTGRFVQHSTGATPALRGAFQFNNDGPLPPDATAPATTGTLTADIVTLNATDPDDPKDVDQTFYQIDHGPTHAYTGPFPIFGPIGATHTVTMWSVDIAGNKEALHDTAYLVQSLAPVTQLTMFSQPGDVVGNGRRYAYDTTTGTFLASTVLFGETPPPGDAYIGYQDRRTDATWSLAFDSFKIPTPLVPGYYTMAQDAYYPNNGFPGIEVRAGAGGGPSFTILGSFQILEAVYGPNNQPLHFAARFAQHYNGAIPALYGTVLYNTTAVIPQDMTAPTTTLTRQGNLMTLTAADPDDPKDIDQTYYQVDHGPTRIYAKPLLLSGAPGSVHTLTVWSVDIAGNQESPRDTQLTVDPKGAFSQLVMHSDPGDDIGAGLNYQLDTSTGTFSQTTVASDPPRQTAYITYTGFPNASGSSDLWYSYFTTLELNAPLVPGFYNGAQGRFNNTVGHPELYVAAPYRSPYNPNGAFEVFDATYDPLTASLISFSARFVQHDNGGPAALRGLIQFNSSAPIRNDLSAPTTTTSVVANQITLTATDADGNADLDQTYYQLDGGATQSYSDVITVGGPVGVKHTITFWSMDIAGNKETPQSVSLTTDGSGPQTYLFITSQPGDFIGQGRNYAFYSTTGKFGYSVTVPAGATLPTQVTFGYTDNAPYGAFWGLIFNTTYASRFLDIGNYDYAQEASFFSAVGFPGMDISGNNSGSSMITGRFSVFDIAVDTSVSTYPRILRFGATFEQHSQGAKPALYGVFRYNSPVPPPPPTPFTTAFIAGTASIYGWYRTPVVVTLSAEDPYNASIITGTQYSLDGLPMQAYSGPFPVSGDGIHTLQFQSEDALSLLEPLVKRTINIDTTPPTLTATLTPIVIPGGYTWESVQGVITDTGSGVSVYSLGYSYTEETQNYHGSGMLTLQAKGAFTGTIYLPPPTKTAKKLKYHITVYGQDMAGNTTTQTFIVPLTLDAIAQ